MYLFAYSMYCVLVVIFDDAYFDLSSYLRAFGFGLLFFFVSSMTFRLAPAIKMKSQSINTHLESNGA